MFGFEYRLILSMFYVWFRVSVDTHYVLCIVSRYHLILDKFYVMFQDYRLGAFMVIVYKALGSLTSVFKHCCSPDLEKADFHRQSFSIYLVEQLLLQFASRIQTKHTYLLGTTW